MGGEHYKAIDEGYANDGSSPRGRGTQLPTSSFPFSIRIIPAWAGNTLPSASAGRARSDHPRVGGEHSFCSGVSFLNAGSSPRGRGTRRFRCLWSSRQRIIPAWAGNTGPTPTGRPSIADHPRVGGEHERIALAKYRSIGSSPRGRGTLPLTPRVTSMVRIIPAWAGNTLPVNH